MKNSKICDSALTALNYHPCQYRLARQIGTCKGRNLEGTDQRILASIYEGNHCSTGGIFPTLTRPLLQHQKCTQGRLFIL